MAQVFQLLVVEQFEEGAHSFIVPSSLPIQALAVAAGKAGTIEPAYCLVHMAGRMNRNDCVMRLRLCATEQTSARLSAVWMVFRLATHASRTRVRGRGPDRAR